MADIGRELKNLQAIVFNLSQGSVQSVQAGTNVTITGSPQNPIINSTASSAGVSSLTVDGDGLLVNQSTGAVEIKNTGVTELLAGTGISVSSSFGSITINNTGITSLSAGTGISVSGSTITNTGITSLTAGAGISVSGSTITNNGVRSVTAGTNVTVTGTANNPIINVSPAPLPAGVAIDINSQSYDFTNPSLLANCVLYSSSPLQTTGITINFPTYAQLVSTYGANAIIPFTIGNLSQNQAAPNQTVYLTCNNDTNPASVYFNQSNDGTGWVTTNPTPSTSTFVLSRGSMWKATVVLDSVRQDAFYCFTWLTYL